MRPSALVVACSPKPWSLEGDGRRRVAVDAWRPVRQKKLPGSDLARRVRICGMLWSVWCPQICYSSSCLGCGIVPTVAPATRGAMHYGPKEHGQAARLSGFSTRAARWGLPRFGRSRKAGLRNLRNAEHRRPRRERADASTTTAGRGLGDFGSLYAPETSSPTRFRWGMLLRHSQEVLVQVGCFLRRPSFQNMF